jgi:hypothetical protein
VVRDRRGVLGVGGSAGDEEDCLMEKFRFEYHEDGEGFRVVRLEDGKATGWLSNEAAFDVSCARQFHAEDIWRNYWRERSELVTELEVG